MDKNRVKKSFIVLAVAACCTAFLAIFIFGGEENHAQVATSKPLSVKTLAIRMRDYRLQVPAYGFVEPGETIEVRAEVQGRIDEVSAGIFTGAAVVDNQLLFTIDDRQYRNGLDEAMAEKSLAEQALEIEKGRQFIASKEWELLEKSKWGKDGNNSLALRKPQLKERQAAVRLAEAKVAQASLDVERTRLHAPCNGVILEENLARGRLLDAGDTAVLIGCTDRFQVTARFSPKYSIAADPSPVRVTIDGQRFDGFIRSTIPRIDPQTRHKQTLIEFNGSPVIGSYASLILPGPVYEKVAVIPREALRADSTVWMVSDDQTMEIRPVEILGEDLEHVVIGGGLAENDHVILSHISSPLAGTQLSLMPPLPEERNITYTRGVPVK